MPRRSTNENQWLDCPGDPRNGPESRRGWLQQCAHGMCRRLVRMRLGRLQPCLCGHESSRMCLVLRRGQYVLCNVVPGWELQCGMLGFRNLHARLPGRKLQPHMHGGQNLPNHVLRKKLQSLLRRRGDVHIELRCHGELQYQALISRSTDSGHGGPLLGPAIVSTLLPREITARNPAMNARRSIQANDVPTRTRCSRTVGASLLLTPTRRSGAEMQRVLGEDGGPCDCRIVGHERRLFPNRCVNAPTNPPAMPQ